MIYRTHKFTFNRVTAIADKLGVEFALIHRQHVSKGEDVPDKMDVLVGDVRDKVRFKRNCGLFQY